MRKTMKKIVSMLVSFVMVVGLFATAMAAQTPLDITITKPDDDKATHKYSAYQIFTGDIYEDTATGEKSLINLQFGEGVDAAALRGALNRGPTATAQECADAIQTDYATDAEGLADLLRGTEPDYTDSILTTATDDATIAPAVTTAVLDVTGPGYYFILDELTNASDADKGAISNFMLKVVEDTDVTVESKEDLPTITKVIDENGGVSANTASIGDEIPFKITSTVPDMTGYNKYYFIVNDVLCPGLTYDATSADLTVSVGGTALTAGTGYTLTVSPDTPTAGETTLKIVFNNFIQYTKGDEVVITYNAILNEGCDRTDAGNENTVDLTYSNDPNHTYTGTNEPDNGEPTGVTPPSNTITYTTDIKLIKLDEDGNALAGAEFEVACTSGMSKVLVTYGEYEVDASGAYWKLNDGTYTTTAPTALTASKYDSETTKYSLTDKTEVQTDATSSKKVTAFVDSSGFLVIEGLCDGTYTITETKAPAGYTGLSAPVSFTVESNPDLTGPNWAVGASGNTASATYNTTDNQFEVTIVNTQGINLPTTGGIGTVIFYVTGGILLLGGAVMLLRKKEQQD